MTVLTLPESRLGLCTNPIYDPRSLRAWLAGRWSILFSHPDDFAQEQLEMDRWISVLHRTFNGRGVAPVALAHAGGEAERGWLGRLAALGRETAAVLTLDTSPADTPADRAAAVLRAEISRSGQRFAMVIDADLRRRRTLSYRLRSGLPSPLDLIGWAVALRKRDRVEAAGTQSSPSFARLSYRLSDRMISRPPLGGA